MESTSNKVQSKRKKGQVLNILLNVVIPSVILTKFSSENYLGQFYGLIVALFFPISYGIFEFLKEKKLNFFSALGFFSVILTGGIGLFKLDKDWMVAKETGIPLIIGLVIIISQLFKHSFIRTFLDQIIDLNKIDEAFDRSGHREIFEKKIVISAYLFGITFFVSAFLNYILAVKILVGAPGSVEFNESLGKMTALSFPVISIPVSIMVGFIIYFLFHSIKKYTDIEIENIMRM